MNGKFLSGPETKIILEGNGLENSKSFLNDYLKAYNGFTLETGSVSKDNNKLVLNFERLDDSIPGAYHLSVNKNGIYIAGDMGNPLF
jgi:hypothetical protein